MKSNHKGVFVEIVAKKKGGDDGKFLIYTR